MKTTEEVHEEIVRKAAVAEAFHAKLLADPRFAIERALGVAIPEGFGAASTKTAS